MSVKVEKLDHNMVKLIVEVEADKFARCIQKAYLANRGRISIPGFRKGKAPRQIIERMYGPGIFFEDAANNAINETYDEAAKETGLDFVSRPVFDIVDIGKDKPFVYSVEIAVKPGVKLGEYRGLKVSRPDTLVTDADVDRELELEQKKNSRKVPVEGRAVENGDTVDLDYVGTVDGVPFEGGTAAGHQLRLGSGSFIPGFEEQLVGMNIGDEKDVTVTFPAEYHAKELAGKEAVFHCKINGATFEELPELNDDFAADHTEFETIAEFREDLAKKIRERKEQSAKTQKENEAVQKAVDAAEIDIPEAMIDAQVSQMFEENSRQLASQGIPMDMYLSYMGMDEAGFKKELRPEALRRIRTRLVLETIADVEGIEISDERYDEEITKMAEQYNMEKETLQKSIGDFEEKQIKQDMAVQDTVTLIVDSAVEE